MAKNTSAQKGQKGISAVIATIMLLMITVALISVFYVFGSGLITTTTGITGSSVTTTTDRMLKNIAMPVYKCTGNTTPAAPFNVNPNLNIITFTAQNVGTKNIISGDLTVYVDDSLVTTTPDAAVTSINANALQAFSVTTAAYSRTRAVKVTGPSNSVQTILSCQ